MADAALIRTTLVDALRLDLVGPDPDEPLHAAHATETLPTAPSTWYLTGFLVPFQAAEPDELCVDVSQIDGAGRESDPVTACGAADIVGGPLGGGLGCGGSGNPPMATTQVEPASAALLLGGIGFLLRRRSRR